MANPMGKYNVQVYHIGTQITKLKTESLRDTSMTWDERFTLARILADLEERFAYAIEDISEEMAKNSDEVHDSD